MIEAQVIVGSKSVFDDLDDPIEHLVEGRAPDYEVIGPARKWTYARAWLRDSLGAER